MRRIARHFMLAALAVPGCVFAAAQPDSDAAAAGQAPQAPSAALALAPAAEPAPASTLEGYRRLDQVPLAPWAQANEVVRSAGGWRAYAREAQEMQPPEAPQPASTTPREPAR